MAGRPADEQRCGHLLSVIYVSVADPLLSGEDVEAILASARRNNERDALTGALVYNGHNFMQLLEGQADRVDACLAAIRDDPRHSGMVEIRRREIERRDFAHWSMLYERNFGDHDYDLGKLAANGQLDAVDERMLANFIALGRRRSSAEEATPLQ